MKKKIFFTLFLIIIVGGILYCSVLCYQKMNTINSESDIQGKEITHEEYIFKDTLLSLGYNISNIKKIENKISDLDVKKYLLHEKYDNLSDFLNSPYFNIKNIERYQSYYNINKYTPEEVVLYVEIDLDRNFYTNIKDTNTSDNELMLVNKYNILDENYVPNLVNIDSKYGTGKLEETTYNNFVKMVDAAKEENIILKSVSAYRSYDRQKYLYNKYVKANGEKKANTYSAKPGHSEHQTGLSVDINFADSNKNFEMTKEYEWLINNSYKYGFILRYPQDKTFITGYKYEPWHYRYVGIDAASKIFENKITFEEYLIKYSN